MAHAGGGAEQQGVPDARAPGTPATFQGALRTPWAHVVGSYVRPGGSVPLPTGQTPRAACRIMLRHAASGPSLGAPTVPGYGSTSHDAQADSLY
jgi:hypothetical protein